MKNSKVILKTAREARISLFDLMNLYMIVSMANDAKMYDIGMT